MNLPKYRFHLFLLGRFCVRLFPPFLAVFAFFGLAAALTNGSEGDTFNWRAGTFTETIRTFIAWPK